MTPTPSERLKKNHDNTILYSQADVGFPVKSMFAAIVYNQIKEIAQILDELEGRVARLEDPPRKDFADNCYNCPVCPSKTTL